MFIVRNRNQVWRASLLQSIPTYGICGIENEPFFARTMQDVTAENDLIDIWSAAYHERIRTLVDQQLDDQYFTPVCDADNFAQFLEPTPIMQTTMKEFDAWKGDPDTNDLSRLDVGIVAFEVLRSYECALFERRSTMISQVADELTFEKLGGISSVSTGIDQAISFFDVSAEYLDQYNKINEELKIARPALEQTMRLINGNERTKILEAEVDCLQRASLDLRNVTSLAAEANACLPRIWNSRDVYRDPNN